MFEKLFGKQKSPEEMESHLRKVIAKEFSIGVNGPAIFNAFTAAQKENTDKKLGFTNNHLLNVVRDAAIASSTSIEDAMYGGAEQTLANINSEINQLREELPKEEQGT